jgi:hypothetical protein
MLFLERDQCTSSFSFPITLTRISHTIPYHTVPYRTIPYHSNPVSSPSINPALRSHLTSLHVTRTRTPYPLPPCLASPPPVTSSSHLPVLSPLHLHLISSHVASSYTPLHHPTAIQKLFTDMLACSFCRVVMSASALPDPKMINYDHLLLCVFFFRVYSFSLVFFFLLVVLIFFGFGFGFVGGY